MGFSLWSEAEKSGKVLEKGIKISGHSLIPNELKHGT